jgi:hypothetical protein
VVLYIQSLEFPSYPVSVTFDLTGPGVPSSVTVDVPEGGTSKSVPAAIDTGCPSPKQTWAATIVSVNGQPPNSQEKAARIGASSGPCVLNG